MKVQTGKCSGSASETACVATRDKSSCKIFKEIKNNLEIRLLPNNVKVIAKLHIHELIMYALK